MVMGIVGSHRTAIHGIQSGAANTVPGNDVGSVPYIPITHAAAMGGMQL